MRRALAVVLAAGCASAPPPAPVTNRAAPRAPAAPELAPPRVALGDITVTFDGQPIGRLHPDGRTESVGEQPPGSPMVPGPALHADGTVTFAPSDVSLHLAADGELRLRSRDSDEHVGHITPDALTFATTPEDPIRLDGDILRLPGGGERNRVIGATTPALRVTTLLLTAAFYLAPSLAR